MWNGTGHDGWTDEWMDYIVVTSPVSWKTKKVEKLDEFFALDFRNLFLNFQCCTHWLFAIDPLFFPKKKHFFAFLPFAVVVVPAWFGPRRRRMFRRNVVVPRPHTVGSHPNCVEFVPSYCAAELKIRCISNGKMILAWNGNQMPSPDPTTHRHRNPNRGGDACQQHEADDQNDDDQCHLNATHTKFNLEKWKISNLKIKFYYSTSLDENIFHFYFLFYYACSPSVFAAAAAVGTNSSTNFGAICGGRFVCVQ